MGRPLYDYIVNKIQCTASVEGAVKTLTLVRQIGKARFLATDGNKLFPVNLVSKTEFEELLVSVFNSKTMQKIIQNLITASNRKLLEQKEAKEDC